MAGNISTRGRIVAGVLAGLLVIANKVISQGASALIAVLKGMYEDSDAVYERWGYGVIALCIIILSVGIAWAVTEQSRFKLLAIAVSAPALVTAWGSGEGLRRLSLISSAYAQTNTPPLTKVEGFWKGVRLFFDGVPSTPGYRVVVASTQDPNEAASVADRVRRQSPEWEVSVADPVPGNSYFAVLAGDALSYSEAKALLQKVRATPLGANAYLSAPRQPTDP